jgi:hypothetical protein
MQAKIVSGYYWEGWRERRQEDAKKTLGDGMQTKVISYEQAYKEVYINGNNIKKIDTSKFLNEQYYKLAKRAVQSYGDVDLSYIDDRRLSDAQYKTIVYEAVKYSGKALKHVNKARFSVYEYYDLASFAVERYGEALEYVDPDKLAEKLHGRNYYTWVVLKAVYKRPPVLKVVNWARVSLPDKIIHGAARGRISRWLYNP